MMDYCGDGVEPKKKKKKTLMKRLVGVFPQLFFRLKKKKKENQRKQRLTRPTSPLKLFGNYIKQMFQHSSEKKKEK